MKITKGLFKTEIEINPGELSDFLRKENPSLRMALFIWLRKYLDFKVGNYKHEK